MKICLFLLAVFSAFVSLYGAKAGDLTNSDEGTLLYRKRDCKVFVFKKVLPDDSWQCTPFRENSLLNLSPADCVILDLDEYTVNGEEIAINYTYYTTYATRDYRKANVFKNIAGKVNSPQTDSILAFSMELGKLLREIRERVRNIRNEEWKERMSALMKKNENRTNIRSVGQVGGRPVYVRGGSNKKPSMQSRQAKSKEEVKKELLQDELQLFLESNPCSQAIRNIASNDENYFIAFSLYLNYEKILKREIGEMDREFVKDISLEIDSLGRTLLTKYQQQRSKNKKRENDFRKLCPDIHGAWEYASARNMNEVRKTLRSFFAAYNKLRNYSSHTEFPKWANAALEVMQMMDSPALERKFDSAFQIYRKRVNP